MMRGRQVGGADLLVDDAQRPLGGQLAVGAHLLVDQAVAVRVGHGRAVDLRENGPNPLLYGIDLAVRGHRRVHAAVIGVVERHHGGLLRVGRAILTAFSTASRRS